MPALCRKAFSDFVVFVFFVVNPARNSAKMIGLFCGGREARARIREALELVDSGTARARWWLAQRDPSAWRRHFPYGINRLAFSPTGDTLAITSTHPSVRLVHLATLREQAIPFPDQVVSIDFTPQGGLIANRGLHLTRLKPADQRNESILLVSRQAAKPPRLGNPTLASSARKPVHRGGR